MGYFVLKDAITCEKTQEYLAITEGPKTAPVTVEYPLATLMVSLTRGDAGSPDNSFFTPKLAGSEGTCSSLDMVSLLGCTPPPFAFPPPPPPPIDLYPAPPLSFLTPPISL